ncbi:hypothetical protein HZI73_15155 [Vallitalea pronyensis]|uniref:Uncharacterized protein n=1 Tax=Vallitalea pronyensis TaxID=1348613 RepID=A0A8J8MKR3_9FIRM|nr:hypothetical protein [Vallitalea pronyensis]QUI23540.1 hypothetical protein HZI73_15155 [Vallitalea pronyensis]
MKSLILVFGVALVVNALLSFYIYRNKRNVEVFDFSLYILITAIIVRPLVEGGLEQWPVILMSTIIVVPLFTVLPLAVIGITSYVWKDFESVCKKIHSFSELKVINPIKNVNYCMYRLEDGTKVKLTKTVGDNRTKITISGGLNFKKAFGFRKRLMPTLKRIDDSKYNAVQSIIYGVMGVVAVVVSFIL